MPQRHSVQHHKHANPARLGRTQMAADIQEWLDVYDELSGFVTRSKYQTFAHNLNRWFAHLNEQPATAALVERLERRTDFQAWYNQCQATVGSMIGSGKLVWPANNEDRIGIQASLFRFFAAEPDRVTDFA